MDDNFQFQLQAFFKLSTVTVLLADTDFRGKFSLY